jgi:polynucleotide 5'-kinase involved in rRNA processing
MTGHEPARDHLRRRLLAEKAGSLIYVVGEPDTGKTTLTHQLGEALSERWRVARLDADPGQSTLGPPACVAAAWAGEDRPIALRFVGDVTPARHLLQTLTGVARLVDLFRGRGAEALVIDSSGYVANGAAREFQFQLVGLLQPDHIVALQRRGELEPLLKSFGHRRAMACHRLTAVPVAHRRSPEQRRRYRIERFADYFASATEQAVDLRVIGLHGMLPSSHAPDRWRNRLAAAIDEEGFVIVLGVVRRFVPREQITLLAPAFDRDSVVSVQMGSLTLPSASEGGSRHDER